VVGMRTMTWAQASARRLARSHLTDATRTDDPAQISADMLGVHAQVMSAAELSIGIRGATLTRTDVRNALWRDRSLVKTRGPRGTVHLLAAADLPMWTGALSAVPAGRSPFAADVQMTGDQIERVVAAIADAVGDAELTVDELTEAIVDRVGTWAGDRVMPAFQDNWPRWRQAEAIAANRGALCFGRVRARRTTYTSPGRWLPGFRPMPAEDALAALIKRFLHAYGPATPAHFAWWLGAPGAWAAGVFARQAGLAAVSFDGTPSWIVEGDEGAKSRAPMVRLLPYFDSYAIGCHPRTTLFPGRAGARALTGGQAGNVPALLVDGVVAGVWHQRRAGSTAAVTVEPLADLSARQHDGIAEQVVRIGQILESAAVLTIGTVTAGAHA
jgi:hypothetical protein